MKIFAYNFMRLLVRVSDEAGKLFIRDMFVSERKGLRLGISRLRGAMGLVDGATACPWRGSGLEPADFESEIL